MPIRVSISGNKGLWGGRCESAIWHLYEALDNFLQFRGEVLSPDEHHGPGWDVQVLLHEDPNVDDWVAGCARYLRQWGVPEGEIHFVIWQKDGLMSNFRRIVVPAELR